MGNPKTIQRVFILGMDGAGNFIQHTPTPNIDAFLKNGAVTYHAQAQSPTISAECWGSIMHGVVPEKHQLNNNVAASGTFPADSPYPSILRLAREAWPEAKLAAFSTWTPINSGIIEEEIGIHKESFPEPELVSAIESYLENNSDVKLLFMQLDEPDHSGHKYGYGPDSPEYLEAITRMDELFGRVLRSIEKNGMLEDSLVILLTDHGGGGGDRYDHGSDHPMDKNVFWGCVGPGVAPGTVLPEMFIVDTAAIAAYALGLQQPDTWDAKVPASLFID
ncbi:alkaline phosphatase family protein [Paenibacillus sp.]|jgi:predicted AlkP superfamily pyrophosphatase or phosphodiesterase|uniref:alkaline phosphatase family protein n=1 Tax=Paenibacillus sp. TaxID=58172 RepID=UPI002835D266|nr:alkaline phosphatase family protein [Paenibacillus sp.]MDR0271528.1 alkaline phosphatase family protein [Paenibacillus sp.]